MSIDFIPIFMDDRHDIFENMTIGKGYKVKLKVKQFIAKMKHQIKVKWHELLNDPSGPHVVALSFAIGALALMLTLPTLGLAFLLMLAIMKWTKHSLTAALVGYFFTKLIAFPLAPLELMIGRVLLHENFDPNSHKWTWARGMLHKGAEFILGATIVGLGLAVIFYFVIKQILLMRLKAKAKKTNVQD